MNVNIISLPEISDKLTFYPDSYRINHLFDDLISSSNAKVLRKRLHDEFYISIDINNNKYVLHFYDNTIYCKDCIIYSGLPFYSDDKAFHIYNNGLRSILEKLNESSHELYLINLSRKTEK